MLPLLVLWPFAHCSLVMLSIQSLERSATLKLTLNGYVPVLDLFQQTQGLINKASQKNAETASAQNDTGNWDWDNPPIVACRDSKGRVLLGTL